ncbi:hypothetical protein SteCoe_8980 [Stentor coeruleus]|uniref:MJ1316 RNA cyclic group end recognition domain-containing protein n=1 Tax=Stentor coeruleus TaxID=5963 RepID=A0A1R2CIW4_9CILI|nr:hypothetical protein SteCoe_8980 [Stentor coeruleus]
MDIISHTPDLIIHYLINFLGINDIARLAAVSNFFHSKCIEYFSSLCLQYNLPSVSPIADFGKIYTQRCLIWESWSLEERKLQYLPYNLVKSIKLASDFTCVLKYNGKLYSNIAGGEIEEVSDGVKEVDACMLGMIYKKQNGTVSWWRVNAGNVLKTDWQGEEPNVIAASVYGIIGLKSGKVIAFDHNYTREVNFASGNSHPISQIKATPKMLLILNEAGQLFSCGLITFEAILITTGAFRYLALGNTHSLALMQKSVTPVGQWSTETLLKFMSSNGFEDCCQLIKNHEIDGTDLEDINEKYFIETLGIREPERRCKLKFLLKQTNTQKYEKDFEILGWGRNNFMQLGPEGIMINNPSIITKAVIQDNDKIESLTCDKMYSYICTSNGKILALGGKNAVKMTKAEKKNFLWEDVSEKILEKGRVVEIEGSNKRLGVIYREENKKKIKVKMRMSEDILKLINNGSLPVEAYEIGYLDRFLGMLEISLKDFNKTDIPKHRIQYFKRNGKIVWDRRSRLDCF